MPHLLFVFRLSTGLSVAQMGHSPPHFGLKDPQMCLSQECMVEARTHKHTHPHHKEGSEQGLASTLGQFHSM